MACMSVVVYWLHHWQAQLRPVAILLHFKYDLWGALFNFASRFFQLSYSLHSRAPQPRRGDSVNGKLYFEGSQAFSIK